MASHNVTLTCFISKFLSTDELNVFAKNDSVLQRYYTGCYPADVMPATIKNVVVGYGMWTKKINPAPIGLPSLKRIKTFFFLTVLERHLNFSNVNIGWIIFISRVGV